MTRTLVGVMHSVSTICIYLFGFAAVVSIVSAFVMVEHPVLPFAGLVVTLVLFGISFASDRLAIYYGRKLRRQSAPQDPPR